MIEKLLNKLLDDSPAELFFLLVGSGLLYFLQVAFEWIRERLARQRLHAELVAYKQRKESINVVDLANGDPEFHKSNIILREIKHLGNPRSLFLNMPADTLIRLRAREDELGYVHEQRMKFKADQSFDGTSSFDDLAEMTGIDGLAGLIEKHRSIVAEAFISGDDGMMFNGEKYGIFNLRFTRFGEDETPGVNLDLFRTDYFTHRVFRSIYQELKSNKHPIAISDITNFLKYRPFLTSFGVNVVLICKGNRGKELVLSKRSMRVNESKSRFHVTVNEGLSQTDKDAFGRVDLELCFKRGLLEELGIDERIYRLATRSCFYDLFLEKNNFEIGLSAMIELDVPFVTEIEPLVARDKTLESDGFLTLPLSASTILPFVRNNEFIPHGLFVLERVLQREGVSISKHWETKRRD